LAPPAGFRARSSRLLYSSATLGGPGTLVDTIDLHTRYLVDDTKPIGFEIPALLPEFPVAIHVHTGRGSDFIGELARPAELAFAFIDADHQHPWPLLDSIRVAPYLQSGTWIVLHDIALGTMGVDQARKGRPLSHGAAFGAEWLFRAWPFPKISGGNIGAVRLPANKRELLPMALQLLAIPFEMDAASHRRMRHALYRAIADLIESCA
jgi:hypothetical protein